MRRVLVFLLSLSLSACTGSQALQITDAILGAVCGAYDRMHDDPRMLGPAPAHSPEEEQSLRVTFERDGGVSIQRESQ